MADFSRERFMKACRRWILFMVSGSACLPSFAVDAARKDKYFSDYQAVCSYILKEGDYAKFLVSAPGASGRDHVLGRGDNARWYRFHNPGISVDYIITSDNRILISRLRMTGGVLLQRAGSEKSLAGKLHVGLPFPAQLRLGCDLYELQVTAVDGKIRSLTIAGLIE